LSVSWIILAISSTIITALSNMLDGHLMARRMPGMRSYLIISGFLILPVSIILLIIFPLPSGPQVPLAVLMVFASAAASSTAAALTLNAMKSEDVARISPVISTSPVFIALLAIVFLGEAILWQQWLAIIAIVTGAILISFKWDSRGSAHFHLRPFLLLMFVSFLWAISGVTNKYALGYISFWNSASLIFMFSALIFMAIFLRKDVLRDIASLKKQKLTIGIVMGNQALLMTGATLSFWATQLGSVSLTSAILNSKPLFVFIFAAIVSRFAPGLIIHEKGNLKISAIKTTAVLLVVGGLAAMFLV
jgi:drug/metabolite transporter (DMT)-like permease